MKMGWGGGPIFALVVNQATIGRSDFFFFFECFDCQISSSFVRGMNVHDVKKTGHDGLSGTTLP